MYYTILFLAVVIAMNGYYVYAIADYYIIYTTPAKACDVRLISDPFVP